MKNKKTKELIQKFYNEYLDDMIILYQILKNDDKPYSFNIDFTPNGTVYTEHKEKQCLYMMDSKPLFKELTFEQFINICYHYTDYVSDRYSRSVIYYVVPKELKITKPQLYGIPDDNFGTVYESYYDDIEYLYIQFKKVIESLNTDLLNRCDLYLFNQLIYNY